MSRWCGQGGTDLRFSTRDGSQIYLQIMVLIPETPAKHSVRITLGLGLYFHFCDLWSCVDIFISIVIYLVRRFIPVFFLLLLVLVLLLLLLLLLFVDILFFYWYFNVCTCMVFTPLRCNGPFRGRYVGPWEGSLVDTYDISQHVGDLLTCDLYI